MNIRKLKMEGRIIPSVGKDMGQLERSCFKSDSILIQQIKKKSSVHHYLLKLDISLSYYVEILPGVGSSQNEYTYSTKVTYYNIQIQLL